MISLAGFLTTKTQHANIQTSVTHSKEQLKSEAFQILDEKCNSCHRKQNPFMVFSLKNMEKRAVKIHQQVIVKRQMPKGDEVKLTQEEYSHLKKWLDSQLNN